ncbi:MAG: hypothetical protein ACRDT8_26500 [Micromonosporaceae bacterium]
MFSRRHLSPGWLVGHLVAVVLVAGCLGLGWWQLERAGAGNVRSWAYAVEWPVFAGFVVFVWFRELRRASAQPAPETEQSTLVEQTPPPAESAGPAGSGPPAPARPGEEDDETAAYNRMLAWLNANPQRRMSDYPG